MNKIRSAKGFKAFCATIIFAVLATGSTTATAARNPAVQQEPTFHIASNSDTIAKHSDKDLLYFLLAGQGPIAEENPDLLKAMNFDPQKPYTDKSALDTVISEYLSYSKEYPKIRQSLTSNNPHKVESGLKHFSDDFVRYLKQSDRLVNLENKIAVTPYGFCGKTVCGAALAVVLANGLLYANVAVATMALAAGAVVTLAVYLEDDESNPNGMTDFERQEITARLARAFA